MDKLLKLKTTDITATAETEKEFVEHFAKLMVAAREYRFWDHYIQLNMGEYGRKQRELYMQQCDASLKALGISAPKRRNILFEFTQTKQTF